MTTPPVAETLNRNGHVWVFGDDINTDDMYPGFAMKLPVGEAAKHMFDATRPGWPELVGAGDIVVAGRNFGLGSSRPVALLFLALGVRCLIAEQFNSLFMRNAINYGLPAVTLPNARELISEGDVLDLAIDTGRGRNVTTGESFEFPVFPDFILEVLRCGGLVSQLANAGYLKRPDAH